MRSFFITLILFISHTCFCQIVSDKDLIKNSLQLKETPVVQKKGRSNPFLFVFNGPLTVYQRFISPQISSNCMFELSCSRFSRDAISQFGPLKGIALTVDRFHKCNRIGEIDVRPWMRNRFGQIIDEPSIYKVRK
jgi:uncharacterized protein